jgi:hypothetical protein
MTDEECLEHLSQDALLSIALSALLELRLIATVARGTPPMILASKVLRICDNVLSRTDEMPCQ